MADLPSDTLILIGVLDLFLLLASSVLCGVVVSHAAGRSRLLGVGVGALAPIVGPAVWGALVALRKDSFEPSDGGLARSATVGLLSAAAVLLLVSLLLPWGSVTGDVGGYRGDWDATPGESIFGAAALGLTAVLLGVGAMVRLAGGSRRRVALSALVVGMVWLVITLDSLLLAMAFNDVAGTAEGLSKGSVEVVIRGGAALFLTLGAAVLLILTAAVSLVPSRSGQVAGAPQPRITPYDFSAGDDW